MKKPILFSLLFFIIFSCKDINKISAGSYPYAEIYMLDHSETDIITRLIKLKENNPDYIVPKLKWAGKETELIDGKDSHWYFFYFYFKDTNDIVEFWTREGYQPNKTKVGLFRVSNGLEGASHFVNKDLSEEENEQLKKEFKKNIIDKIQ
ncbi:hypothetical protein N0B16_12905 [Chryseobacterium sp. GMJ5]|uniref:Lipoprotein n=1 Tax=Chryseobacterium gilvum TaxID=2976534 RepID=A0ABT2VZA8_9FLAO|nr:hypothetical protein [Chryseobacterium gilvum]MCU7615339.1 hypothetical protein [Chryseobacterium gilvum]